MVGTPEERFDAKVRLPENPEGCWEWTAHRLRGGYGQFTSEKVRYMAHRWSYERSVGPIPEGLQIDHLCRNRRCVNPKHLEPVTPRENLMRSPVAPAKLNTDKTVCPRGHPLVGKNLYRLPSGSRTCRICNRTRGHQYDLVRRPRIVVGGQTITF